MASSKARDGTNLKEKETSSPSSRLQRTPSSNERRSPRPSTPEKHLPVKQTTNNLKPKLISPAMNTPKSIKSHQSTPTATVKRTAAAQKPLSPKPRSPSTGQVRLPYAAPKQFSSLKPSLEKVAKNAAGKLGQLAKTKYPNSRTEAPAPVAPIPNEEKHKEDTCDIVEEKLEYKQEQEQEQAPVDSATIEASLDDSPQLINCADKVTDDPVQITENLAEAISTENVVAEQVNELESKSANKGQEVQVAEQANEEAKAEAKPLMQEVKVAEQASEEAKPTVIRTAKDASSRNVTAAKKEAICHNDVIEEAKSKFLEKRKNKVLALVGAFETVMALQEPEGQQGQH